MQAAAQILMELKKKKKNRRKSILCAASDCLLHLLQLLLLLSSHTSSLTLLPFSPSAAHVRKCSLSLSTFATPSLAAHTEGRRWTGTLRREVTSFKYTCIKTGQGHTVGWWFVLLP